MRTKFLVILLLLPIAKLFAQPEFITLHSGANLSNYSGSDETFMAGYQVGTSVTIRLSQKFYLEPALCFTSKNSEYHFENFEHDGNTHSMMFAIKANILQFPVMAVYRIPFTPSKPNFLQLKLGPYLSYGVGGNITDKDAYFYRTMKVKTFSDRFIKPWDFGLRTEVALTIQRFSFGMGMDAGLIDVSKIQGKSVQTVNLWTSVGYNFYLK